MKVLLGGDLLQESDCLSHCNRIESSLCIPPSVTPGRGIGNCLCCHFVLDLFGDSIPTVCCSGHWVGLWHVGPALEYIVKGRFKNGPSTYIQLFTQGVTDLGGSWKGLPGVTQSLLHSFPSFSPSFPPPLLLCLFEMQCPCSPQPTSCLPLSLEC